MMTDIWCFTCDHELRRLLTGGLVHLHADEALDCPCIDEEEKCEPR